MCSTFVYQGWFWVIDILGDSTQLDKKGSSSNLRYRFASNHIESHRSASNYHQTVTSYLTFETVVLVVMGRHYMVVIVVKIAVIIVWPAASSLKSPPSLLSWLFVGRCGCGRGHVHGFHQLWMDQIIHISVRGVCARGASKSRWAHVPACPPFWLLSCPKTFTSTKNLNLF